jgi:hypothetical protein
MSEPAIERHIFGDSNIVRYLPKLQEVKTDPSIQAITFTKSTNSVLLRDGLSNPKSAYTFVIVAALTNLITAKFFEDYDLLIEHCKAVFNDVLLWAQEGRDNLDGFAALVSILFYLLFVILGCSLAPAIHMAYISVGAEPCTEASLMWLLAFRIVFCYNCHQYIFIGANRSTHAKTPASLVRPLVRFDNARVRKYFPSSTHLEHLRPAIIPEPPVRSRFGPSDGEVRTRVSYKLRCVLVTFW